MAEIPRSCSEGSSASLAADRLSQVNAARWIRTPDRLASHAHHDGCRVSRLWALSAVRSGVYVVGVAPRSAGYQPRAAEHDVLYCVIDEHLETFLDAAAQHGDGHRLPKFVEQEFRDFLTCGVLAHGFARLRCGDCAFERLVPFL